MSITDKVKYAKPFQVENTLHVIYPIELYPMQDDVLVEESKYILLRAHRRWGKSYICAQKLILSAMMTQKRAPIFAYIFPKLNQGYKNVWDTLKTLAKHIPGVRITEEPMEIKFNWSDGYGDRTIRLLGSGADGMGSALKGGYYDGIIMDEMEEQTAEAWEGSIFPMIEGRGGWAILTGTAGLGYWQELWDREGDNPDSIYKRFDIRISDTKRLGNVTGKKAEEAIERLRKGMLKAEFEKYFMNNPHSPGKGSYYGEVLYQLMGEGFIGNDVAEYNTAYKTMVSFDLGYTDETVAIFYQYYNHRYHIIDYQYWTKTLNTDIVKDISKKPYDYAYFLTPHDAIAKTGGHTSGSFVDILRRSFPSTIALVAPNPGNTIGKEAAHTKTRETLMKCSINAVKAKRLIHALNLFGSKWNPKTQTTSTQPEKSWAAHSADSLQTFALLEHKLDLNNLLKGSVTNQSSGIIPYSIEYDW